MKKFLLISCFTLSLILSISVKSTPSTEVIVDVNWSAIPDKEIQKLADSGRICKVIDHRWEELPWVYAVINIDGTQEQVCTICGKHRTRSYEEWNEHKLSN